MGESRDGEVAGMKKAPPKRGARFNNPGKDVEGTTGIEPA